MPRTTNGHLIAFHLDSRLLKLKVNFDRIQRIQDDLLDRFNSEYFPLWIQHDETFPAAAIDFTPPSNYGAQ